MRPVVSLVEARPETIAEDYRRALSLAGLDREVEGGSRAVAATLDGAGWRPGRTCPPWQVAAALAAAAGGATGEVTVAAVGPAGLQPWPGGSPWGAVAGGLSLVDAAAARGAPVPWRPREGLDSLTAAGGQVSVPFALRHRPLLLLAAADLVSPWRLEGACAAAGRLLLGGHPARRGVPEAEVRAETVAALRAVFPVCGAVVDGTVWHVGPRGRALARHVVIAGDDPLAVDAVALRLAGIGPREAPWLRLCAERGLGAVETTDIRLAGHVDLLTLDFDLPEPKVAPPALAALGTLPRALARLWPGPRGAGRNRPGGAAGALRANGNGGPWAALHEEFASGRR